MSIVSGETIKSGDNVYHEFIDHTGKVSRSVLYSYPADWGEVGYAAQRAKLSLVIDEHQKQKEINQYLSKIRAGINPFRGAGNKRILPKYNTFGSAVYSVIKLVSSLTNSDLLEYRAGLGFMTNLTQTEVESLGFNWIRYENWKASIQSLSNSDIAVVSLEVR